MCKSSETKPAQGVRVIRRRGRDGVERVYTYAPYQPRAATQSVVVPERMSKRDMRVLMRYAPHLLPWNKETDHA
jgi:hypothetical protein